MPSKYLNSEYHRLRDELEAAYAEPVWNTGKIDRIANAIARLEWTSIMRVVRPDYLFAAKSTGVRHTDMNAA